MNNLLILPGNSVKNKLWGDEIQRNYGIYFDQVHNITYDHWTNGQNSINFSIEEAKLKNLVNTFLPATRLTVIAKSAGTILTFLAVHSGTLKPQQCYFFGIPLDMAAVDIWSGGWDGLESYSVPTIAFHNEHDPTAEYTFTKQILSLHAPLISFVTLPGADHAYDQYEAYEEYIRPQIS